MSRPLFPEWVCSELGLNRDQLRAMNFEAVVDVFISRIEAAAARGAADPLVTVTAKIAGGNSRACTRRMLDQLGYEPTQRRAIHRLIAGSPSGWPGLLRLYAIGTSLSEGHRAYARAQAMLVLSGGRASSAGRAARPAPDVA